MFLAQINIGTNFGSLAGLIYLLLTFAYLFMLFRQNRLPRWVQLFFLGEIVFVSIVIPNATSLLLNTEIIITLFYILAVLPLIFVVLAQFGLSNSRDNIFVKIFELIIIPNVLFFGGTILMFQGWRLDPILQTQAVWMLIIIIYLIFKSRRQQQ